jgi:Zn-dependent protease
MFPSFRLGSLFGFPIRVHLSFLLMLGLVLIGMGGVVGLLVALTVAGCVVVHELGHALVARHLGVPVTGIGLHFFGGAAAMAGLPRRPGDEIAIAAAGPAVSFALAGLGHGLAMLTGVGLFALFGWVNLILATFNLLPAFPSDGGRILRAWLARKRGLLRATELAVKVGRVACVVLAVTGIAVGSFQLVLVAIVLWTMGSAERLAVRLRGDTGAWDPVDAPARVEYIPRADPHRPGRAAPRADGEPIVFVWRRF